MAAAAAASRVGVVASKGSRVGRDTQGSTRYDDATERAENMINDHEIFIKKGSPRL